jgi:hypothetical protein
MTLSSGRTRKRRRSMNVWAIEEIRALRSLAAQGVPADGIALALGRTEFAIRNKAVIHGISLRRAVRR